MLIHFLEVFQWFSSSGLSCQCASKETDCWCCCHLWAQPSRCFSTGLSLQEMQLAAAFYSSGFFVFYWGVFKAGQYRTNIIFLYRQADWGYMILISIFSTKWTKCSVVKTAFEITQALRLKQIEIFGQITYCRDDHWCFHRILPQWKFW